VGLADFITSTTHKTLRGPRGGLILCEETYGPTIDKGIFPGIQGGPLMHIIAAKAVSFGEALRKEFRDYQLQVVTNARVLSEELMRHGFDLVSGGTDNHLILIDLTSRDITGQEYEISLGKAGIAANKNAVPFDKRGPKVTSGLRIGTPSLTTRGMKETEMKVIAGLLKNVLKNPLDEKTLQDCRSTVTELCKSFPIYRDLT
jgi:glycine hydroxymethyltransferase